MWRLSSVHLIGSYGQSEDCKRDFHSASTMYTKMQTNLHETEASCFEIGAMLFLLVCQPRGSFQLVRVTAKLSILSSLDRIVLG